RRLDNGDRLGVLVAEQEGRDHEGTDHEQRREQDREDESAATAALEDLAFGDEPDASPSTHDATSTGWDPSAGVVGVTASMNSSESLGGWYANVRTSPAAVARARSASRSTSSRTSSFTRSPSRSSTDSVPSPSSQVPSEPTTSTSRWRRPDRALSSSIAPAATTRPRAMITTSSQTSSTRSS